jgi:hypothetical protein
MFGFAMKWVTKHKLLKVRLLQGRKLPQTYACRECGRTYSFEEYEESRFCRDCAVYLMPESKVVKSGDKKLSTEEAAFVLRKNCREESGQS